MSYSHLSPQTCSFQISDPLYMFRRIENSAGFAKNIFLSDRVTRLKTQGFFGFNNFITNSTVTQNLFINSA
jgi:hypothetical protein